MTQVPDAISPSPTFVALKYIQKQTRGGGSPDRSESTLGSRGEHWYRFFTIQASASARPRSSAWYLHGTGQLERMQFFMHVIIDNRSLAFPGHSIGRPPLGLTIARIRPRLPGSRYDRFDTATMRHLISLNLDFPRKGPEMNTALLTRAKLCSGCSQRWRWLPQARGRQGRRLWRRFRCIVYLNIPQRDSRHHKLTTFLLSSTRTPFDDSWFI